jgi:hypothetical protein
MQLDTSHHFLDRPMVMTTQIGIAVQDYITVQD